MNEEGSASSQEDLSNDSKSVESDQTEEPSVDTEEIDPNKLENSIQSDQPIEESADSSSDSTNQILDNEARLQQLEREHETLRNQYVRIAADFDNFRKRQSRDQDDLRLQLQCNTLSEILPVVDNFERARQQLTPESEEAQSLHRNYQGLYKQLVEVLKNLGVAPMRVVGQSFDPTLHEAVLREPSDDYSEDIVVEELQRGYHLNGRVLRHALVKVSMGPGPNDKNEDESQKDTNETEVSDDSTSDE
mgnify:CR=1 FL=1